jgi:hypothetical protein
MTPQAETIPLYYVARQGSILICVCAKCLKLKKELVKVIDKKVTVRAHNWFWAGRLELHWPVSPRVGFRVRDKSKATFDHAYPRKVVKTMTCVFFPSGRSARKLTIRLVPFKRSGVTKFHICTMLTSPSLYLSFSLTERVHVYRHFTKSDPYSCDGLGLEHGKYSHNNDLKNLSNKNVILLHFCT